MLKTRHNGETWCITQPDHAGVAGYLAAHWGNRDFSRPGDFAAAPDPERLRAEVIFGIAQHDNGWWEWEADPALSDRDGLPLDLLELVRDQQEGMRRWRLGVPRFQDSHPYASLLISFHAYWLYAPRCREDTGSEFIHSLFQSSTPSLLEGEELQAARAFVDELEQWQADFKRRLERNAATAGWIAPPLLYPHVRLLQVLDALSLSLCSPFITDREHEPIGPGQNTFTLRDVPGRSWEAREAIRVWPLEPGKHPGPGNAHDPVRIACRPYPFDTDPLPVPVPLKVVPADRRPAGPFTTAWNTWPVRMIHYEFVAG